jgi:hypothetical protein
MIDATIQKKAYKDTNKKGLFFKVSDAEGENWTI